MENNETTLPTTNKAANQEQPFEEDLTETELEQVSGGLACDGSVSQPSQLNIGSQSTGAGAGKVTFNPFSITRKK